MGSGYAYKCSKCGESYKVYTGIGFLFPQVYKKLIADMKKGRYGEERKELFKKIPLLAVDAEKEYYECEECGYWSVSECKDLYKPKKVDKILKQEYGDKTVEELGEAPYVMGYDLKHNYGLVQKYDHRCPKCKGYMKKRNIRNVCCPKCGTKNKPLGNVMWD